MVQSEPSSVRISTEGGRVDQFDRVYDRNCGRRGDLRDAADIAGGDHIRLDARDIRDLAIAQGLRDVGLEDVVGSRRPAAEMRLGDRARVEARAAQQSL